MLEETFQELDALRAGSLEMERAMASGVDAVARLIEKTHDARTGATRKQM
ncbi:MAG: hypothetical protein WCK47_13710 [bacterium]